MKIDHARGSRAAVAALLAGLISAGCTIPTSPMVLGPVFAPPGSEWSYVRRDSGSFGTGVTHVAGKSLGAQDWQGRKLPAYEGPEATTLLDPGMGGMVAQTKDAKPLVSWDPPIGYHWPLWVGETWSAPYRVTNHATQQTTEMRAWFTVEAQEHVNVPAGTFKVFRIRYADPYIEALTWWSPDLGLLAKSRIERTTRHPAGPGVREADLLTYSAMR